MAVVGEFLELLVVGVPIRDGVITKIGNFYWRIQTQK
jgi:hypothetical protein